MRGNSDGTSSNAAGPHQLYSCPYTQPASKIGKKHRNSSDMSWVAIFLPKEALSRYTDIDIYTYVYPCVCACVYS